MVSPALPRGTKATHPAMLRPKSSTTPPARRALPDGRAAMAGVIWPRSVPVGTAERRAAPHPESSYPGIVHRPSSMRASYSSPSYSLLARIGPAAVTFQLSSLTSLCVLPSAYSTMMFTRQEGSPNTGVFQGLSCRIGK